MSSVLIRLALCGVLFAGADLRADGPCPTLFEFLSVLTNVAAQHVLETPPAPNDLARRLEAAGFRAGSPEQVWFEARLEEIMAADPTTEGRARLLSQRGGIALEVATRIVLYYEHTGRFAPSPEPSGAARAEGTEPTDTWTRALFAESPAHAEVAAAFGSRPFPRYQTSEAPPPEVERLLAAARASPADRALWRLIIRRAEQLRLNLAAGDAHPNRVRQWLLQHQQSLYGLYGWMNEALLIPPLLPAGAHVIPGTEIRVGDRFINDGWQYRIERPEGGAPRFIIERIIEVKSSHNGLVDGITQIPESLSRLLLEGDAVTLFGQPIPANAIFLQTQEGPVSLAEIRRRHGDTFVFRGPVGEPTATYQARFNEVFGADFAWLVVPRGQAIDPGRRVVGAVKEGPMTRQEAIASFADFLRRHVNPAIRDTEDVRAALFPASNHVPLVASPPRSSPRPRPSVAGDAPQSTYYGAAEALRKLTAGFPAARASVMRALLQQPTTAAVPSSPGEHPIPVFIRTTAARWREVFPTMDQEAERALVAALHDASPIVRSIAVEILFNEPSLSPRLRAAVLRATTDTNEFIFRVAQFVVEKHGIDRDPAATNRRDVLLDEWLTELARPEPNTDQVTVIREELDGYVFGRWPYAASGLGSGNVRRLAALRPMPRAVREFLVRLAREGNATAREAVTSPDLRDAAVDALLLSDALAHRRYNLSYFMSQPALLQAERDALVRLAALVPPPAGIITAYLAVLTEISPRTQLYADAVTGLTGLHTPRETDRRALVALLDHSNRTLREASFGIIASMQPPEAGAEARIAAFLSDRYRSTRNAAAQALLTHGLAGAETNAQIAGLVRAGRID